MACSQLPYSSLAHNQPMESTPTVVITGIGIVSPLGIGLEAYWQSLEQRRSGVDVLPGVERLDLPLRIGAAVKNFDAKQYVKPRKALKVMSREIQMGFAAASMAVEHAGLGPDQLPPDRTGVLFASDMLYCEPSESVSAYAHCTENGKFHPEQWGKVCMSELYPLWMLMYLPNMTACHIGIAHDARGPNNTICQGDASSLQALIEAAVIIQRGQADVMITGGSSSRVTATSMLYRGMDGLSRRIDTPASACRPFDATRDGVVHGEGAATFIVEREEFAAARGATILARLTGWGMAFAAPTATTFTPGRAIERSIEQMLATSRWSARDVGHVNAHATGSIVGDAVEAQAIRNVLDDAPVTALKSYFGNLGAAGGALEMAASVLALSRGSVPVTLNYAQPDPACPVNIVVDTQQPPPTATAAVLSQSSAGQTVCVGIAR